MKKILALILVLISSPAFAQTPQPKSDQPVEITADGSLEWNRNEKTFIARKNALAKQGESSIHAETLTAHYRDGQSGGMDIHQVQAESSVELKSKDSTAYGDRADYDLDKGYAIMTGQNLKMVSPDQVVTAHEKFEYWVNEGKLNAVGNARADRKNSKGETDTLEADTISAILKDDAQGQRKLETLEAVNNVVITTPTEKITGQHGIYHASTNKATLTGGVVLHRGPNVLEGDRAEVDMNTNTSQLFGGAVTPTASGQVRGVFYPGSEKKSDGSPREIIPPSPVNVPLPNASAGSAPQSGITTNSLDEDTPHLLTVP
jgi:lipopolysaccharide export system protein LptA